MDLQVLTQHKDLSKLDKELGATYWSPVDVAYINDWVVRMAAFKGEYHWHSHKDDELFIIYKGSIVIDTENGPLALSEGQVAVIPKGMRHKPKADERALVLMIEPATLQSKGS